MKMQTKSPRDFVCIFQNLLRKGNSYMKVGVVVFPGSNGDHDALYALGEVLGQQAELVWHTRTDLDAYDLVVLPGGFSYGDYLRAGAIARFTPVMDTVKRYANAGGWV